MILDGRIVYVIDGYTTTDHYPNAQRADTPTCSEDSGLAGDFNYVRNSVKAVVDAYDGTITIYVIDDDGSADQGLPEGLPRAVHAGHS